MTTRLTAAELAEIIQEIENAAFGRGWREATEAHLRVLRPLEAAVMRWSNWMDALADTLNAKDARKPVPAEAQLFEAWEKFRALTSVAEES